MRPGSMNKEHKVVAFLVISSLALAGYGFARFRAAKNEKTAQFTKIFNN